MKKWSWTKTIALKEFFKNLFSAKKKLKDQLNSDQHF